MFRCRRRRRVYEEFDTLIFDDGDWKSYTHLEGDKRQIFMRLYKRPRIAFLLAVFLGIFGAHRFYLGDWRFGLSILCLTFFNAWFVWTPLLLAVAIVWLIEVGHIVRTTEQWNDSIEGALMLETYSKPLFATDDS